MGKIFAAIICMAIALSFCSAASAVVLLTKEEGAMQEAPKGVYEVSRPLNNGPKIMIVIPEANHEYRSPLAIEVRFIPREDSEVDLSQFKVECLKFFNIDITDRVKRYTTKQGVKVDRAELPVGNHKLRLTIGDTRGGITQEIFVVKVIE
ncbi:MAG: hypothetical protein ACLQF0_14065 [Dissulfurispiraceae bacterium]